MTTQDILLAQSIKNKKKKEVKRLYILCEPLTSTFFSIQNQITARVVGGKVCSSQPRKVKKDQGVRFEFVSTIIFICFH